MKKRSECKCPCHQEGVKVLHVMPCCTPDVDWAEFELKEFPKDGLKRGEMFTLSSFNSRGSGKSMIGLLKDRPKGVELSFDAAELEARALAYLRVDAENTETFERDGDPSPVDITKLKARLSLKDAENILDGGVVDPVDLHESKAAELFSCKPEAVTDKMRSFAKCYNFAELYGAPFPSVQARIDSALEKMRTKVG